MIPYIWVNMLIVLYKSIRLSNNIAKSCYEQCFFYLCFAAAIQITVLIITVHVAVDTAMM